MEIWFYRDSAVNSFSTDDMSRIGDLFLAPENHVSDFS